MQIGNEWSELFVPKRKKWKAVARILDRHTEDRVGGYGIVSDNDMGRNNSVSKW